MTNRLSFWGRVKFRWIFGISPDIPADPLALKAKQEVVDSKLKELALEFAFADFDERRYLTQLKGKHAWNAYQLSKEAKGRLKRTKRAFWNVHHLVKKAGWPVKTKFSAYLAPGSFFYGAIPVTKQHVRPPDYTLTSRSITRLDEIGIPNQENG